MRAFRVSAGAASNAVLLIGLALAVAGVYLLTGPAWALLTTGALVAVYGAALGVASERERERGRGRGARGEGAR